MSRIMTDQMQTPDGNLVSNALLQQVIPSGYRYHDLLIETNIPASSFSAISVNKSADALFSLSGHEIVNVLERMSNRNPTTIIPLRFTDVDAMTRESQERTALIPYDNEQWLLKMQLGVLPTTVPAGGWFLRVHRRFSSVMGIAIQNGQPYQFLRAREFERRFDRKTMTAVVEGENTFDKLIRDPSVNIRKILFKGDIEEVEFFCKTNGETKANWKVTKALNEYLLKVSAQKNGYQIPAGYFPIDFTAGGHPFADMMVTAYDEIIIKFKSKNTNPVEILTEYVRDVRNQS